MPDRPCFMEAVDERSMGVGLAALFDIASHAQIAVADSEQRLGDTKIIRAVVSLGELPLVHWEAVAIQRIGGADRIVGTAACHDASSARSATTTSAPDSVRRCAPTPRSTPTT